MKDDRGSVLDPLQVETVQAVETEQPLWKIVPLAQFELPATPAQEAATKRLHAFRRLFQSEDVPAQERAKTREDLRSLPEARLVQMAPPVPWHFAAEALDIRLGQWARSDAAAEEPRFLVGPPHGGHDECLEAWSKTHGWTLIAPPSGEQILIGAQAWLTELEGVGGGWVLPRLERCFLRHGEGLALVRRFLEHAVAGRLGRGVIGCDSWGWAFLQRVWAVPQPEVFTLQAFDGSSLAAYFRRFTHDPEGRPVRVRNAKTGEDVLPQAEADARSEMEPSPDLTRLAAHCRGNLGIALAYWRAGLRAEPDSDVSMDVSPDGSDIEQASVSGAVTLWWENGRGEPALSPGTTDDVAHILHALLLHNGLPRDLLAELLPGSRSVLSGILQHLKRLGLIECMDEIWRVTALGYDAVREFLHRRGYLTDSL